MSWINTKDRLPELLGGFYSDEVLIVVDWAGGRLVRAGRLSNNKGWLGEDDDTVTHWQPLPEPPEPDA